MLLIACANIDEVVAIIRSSQSTTEAQSKLIARFNFNEEQVKAILNMKLASLTKIDAVKLDNEKKELVIEIERLNHLLLEPSALDEELIKILQEVADKFGDERRTKVLNYVENSVDEEVEVQKEDVELLLFDNNMIRLQKANDKVAAKRGTKGKKIKAPKNATLINTLYCTNLSSVSCFANSGKMYNFNISELSYDEDIYLNSIIPISNEKVLILIDNMSLNSYKHLITISKNGYVKKTKIGEYNVRSKKGTLAVKLNENDYLTNVFLSVSDDDKLFIAGENGYYNYYSLSMINSTGRATLGVKAIKLKDNEKVASAALIKASLSYVGLLAISTSGRGKITKLEDYSETSRCIKGNGVIDLNEDEKLSSIGAILSDKDIVQISSNNKIVNLKIEDIPIQSRLTIGVKLIDSKNSNNLII